MNKIDGLDAMRQDDYLALDFWAIRTFLTVLQTGSVTAAANQLDITQSAVSHALERLRNVFQDPLFTRAGRGIIPTARALALGEELRQLQTQMSKLVQPPDFSPSSAVIHWQIAANDFQRDLILPDFYRLVASQVKMFHLHVVPSGIPSVEPLRAGSTELILSPAPPDAPDILQKRLFSDRNQCFYDATVRKPPITVADFQEAGYISLSFLSGKSIVSNPAPLLQDIERNIRIRVSNFAGLARFMRGTDLLAIAPTLMQHHTLQGFSTTPLPINTPTLSMYMVWHKRHQSDPMHSWLRGQLLQSCARFADEPIHLA